MDNVLLKKDIINKVSEKLINEKIEIGGNGKKYKRKYCSSTIQSQVYYGRTPERSVQKIIAEEVRRFYSRRHRAERLREGKNMAKQINNMRDLEKALQPVLAGMADKLTERVYETLNYFLLDYYTGWTPSSYRRTQDFLHSAVKVEAKPYKGGVKASVYIDYNSLDSYRGVSGYQVAEWANEGKHGGIEADPMYGMTLWMQL